GPARLLSEVRAEQAAIRPDALAAVAGPAQLSYGQLAGWANRLAHRLRALGVGPEVVVGVCLARGPAVVAAVVGVLEAGGVFVLVDPADPPARAGFVLDDAGARGGVGDAGL